MNSTEHGSDQPLRPVNGLVHEVRYSLPELLTELKLEQASGMFAHEKLSQSEIAKFFPAPPKRRVKTYSQ